MSHLSEEQVCSLADDARAFLTDPWFRFGGLCALASGHLSSPVAVQQKELRRMMRDQNGRLALQRFGFGGF